MCSPVPLHWVQSSPAASVTGVLGQKWGRFDPSETSRIATRLPRHAGPATGTSSRGNRSSDRGRRGGQHLAQQCAGMSYLIGQISSYRAEFIIKYLNYPLSPLFCIITQPQ